MPVVEVNFAKPFPAQAPDLAAFLPRHQGQYTLVEDTTVRLLVKDRLLVQQQVLKFTATRHQLDSLRLAAGSKTGPGSQGQQYQLQATATDSLQVRWVRVDTLVNLGHCVKLRRYRGKYYLSRPNADSATWTVQRLTLTNHQLTFQSFNPDSLRIKALDPSTVQQRHEKGQLIFTLAPDTRRAVRQVATYDGLWLMASS